MDCVRRVVWHISNFFYGIFAWACICLLLLLLYGAISFVCEGARMSQQEMEDRDVQPGRP